MKELLIATCLTLFVVNGVTPSVISRTRFESEGSVKTNHVRVRRQNFDVGGYLDNLWRDLNKCRGCRLLSIGNGEKNTNQVYFGDNQNAYSHVYDKMNIGNGYKNMNAVHFSGNHNARTPNNGEVNIGNGQKNFNVINYGNTPVSNDKDPFDTPFFNN